MARSSRSATKKPKAAAADRFTALPLELRAQIASFLPYPQVAQLAVLSRPWRHIHLHTPVVDLNLDEFLYFAGAIVDDRTSLRGLLDDDALLGVRHALLRRAKEGSSVDVLRLVYSAGDPRVRRHADRIIALADASDVVLSVPFFGARPSRATAAAWALDVPPSTRYLELNWNDYLAPAIAGPGAAALRELCLENLELRRWPRLPSLRTLTLSTVNVKGPFAPAACYPLLEDLCMCHTNIEHARVDIRLPALKSLDMDDVDVSVPGDHDGSGPCCGDITVDAPMLEAVELKGTAEWTVEYKSFTLRAPRLRCLSWYGQYTRQREEPYSRDMKYFRAQMLQMLQGLLPDLPPETVANVARPYMTVDAYTVEAEGTGEMIPEERLTCNLTALMST
ncbi:hypothetical protein SETIT_2G141200v2 [Setaria italica]|uniref:F-box domain-containing protein n=2 Tax=Setaria italica TaxID=4555 RepID=A0A368PZ91_SETIT|nr:hypothetical protein SETIT_2G141200v2 [Setaria italica]